MVDQDSAVYIIDDDPSVRTALDSLLTIIGWSVWSFGSVEEFMKTDQRDAPSCLVLDVRLPGMSGLEFQEELIRRGRDIPIIFITAHGDSPMTRRAMKAGAIDFLTKPFRKKELLEAIQQALDHDRERRAVQREVLNIHSHYETLTRREREVLDHVVRGLLNKQIATELEISEASIKFHRAHVMQKMQADSLASLVKMMEKLNLFQPQYKGPATKNLD